MIGFENIPNKSLVKKNLVKADLWPELGNDFELNQFYQKYDSAEGWLGEGYFVIWSQQEVLDFREPILEAYAEKFHFFASDGGGTQFGFFTENEKIFFVSAPNIGNEDDIRVLGNWQQLLEAVQAGDYI